MRFTAAHAEVVCSDATAAKKVGKMIRGYSVGCVSTYRIALSVLRVAVPEILATLVTTGAKRRFVREVALRSKFGAR